MLGSEGILGVITEAWMRVHPRPRWRASASVQFERFEDGVAAARALAQSGLYPANCRLLDPHEAMLHGVAMGASVLFIGFESADHPLETWMERALAIARGAGGTSAKGAVYKAEGEKGRAEDTPSSAASPRRELHQDRWRKAFFEAPYLQSALISLGVVVDTFETACTWDRFGELHTNVLAAVHGALKEACGGGVVSCRFTHVYPDGPAPYYTFVAQGRAGAELAQWESIKRAASDALAASGATITHHHAIGRLHRPWYDRERPEAFAVALRAAKRALDPAGILNPGVLIDP
jgi:alkyldihydroxyacetonephosphate synthase